MNKIYFKKFVFTLSIIAFLPFVVLAQSIDLKLTMLRAQTPYISNWATGFGIEADYNVSSKFTANLKISSISNDTPFIILNELGNVDSGINVIDDDNKVLEVNALFSLLGSKKSIFNLRAGVGLAFQSTKTDYLEMGLFEQGELVSISENSIANFTSFPVLYLEQQFKLNDRFFISVGLSTFIQDNESFPIISGSSASVYNETNLTGSYNSTDAPNNRFKYSLSFGTRLFSL